ncbi:flagellar basal body rod protein FlgB [Propionivibrio dicarboxylicus]|uniref:flagellar basal body rod protein FlgB n=1 Tax=Propionivibrio dicarboxylicus TaxID=83767 RepID=UPI003182F3E4
MSRIDQAFAFQERALNLRAYRQQVLASNIANADTPNYKSRDFDFASALKGAMAGQGQSDLAMEKTSPMHLSGSGDQGLVSLQYRSSLQPSADGNTVDMDIERGEFSENAVRYEAGITFLSHQIKMLTAALQS